MKTILRAALAFGLGLAILLGAVVFSAPDKAKEEGLSSFWGDRAEGGAKEERAREAVLTRAEFAAFLRDAFSREEAPEEKSAFTDVSEGHFAYDDICWAVEHGYLQGYPNGQFAPEDAVTYEQAVTALCRVLGMGAGAHYPRDYVALAIDYSLTDGVDALFGEALNHGQAAQLIVNTLATGERLEERTENGLGSSKAMASSGASARQSAIAFSSAMMDADDSGLASPGESLWGMPGYRPVTENTSEEYTSREENVFKNVSTSPLSTLSIDTDTASYSNIRRFILQGQDIAEGSVRTEEMINYFDYAKATPADGVPFGVNTQVAPSPWNEEHYLAMLTIAGEELTERKPSNLVFLVDISGSMYSYNKLPLVKDALSMLLDQLTEEDRVSIVTYASGTQVALKSTKASKRETILSVIDSLRAGGATAGADGLRMAYQEAERYKTDGNNRIILCTDGDFNVGPASDTELKALIEDKRKSGIYLSVLGFGMGNYKDSKMELLADYGNGNYAYIDNLREAKKVLVDEMQKTIYTIAKDVKIQVEFNPAVVESYRLIGYENRLLNNEDFDNDQKDAGELGAGASVTVLYEIVPGDGTVSGLKYQTAKATGSDELMTVKIRYKEPTGEESLLCEYPVALSLTETPSEDFYFAAAVAEFGMLLTSSEFSGSSSYDTVIHLARRGRGEDAFGLRTEFIQLVDLWHCQTRS